jgi:hypothetical protein
MLRHVQQQINHLSIVQRVSLGILNDVDQPPVSCNVATRPKLDHVIRDGSRSFWNLDDLIPLIRRPDLQCLGIFQTFKGAEDLPIDQLLAFLHKLDLVLRIPVDLDLVLLLTKSLSLSTRMGISTITKSL